MNPLLEAFSALPSVADPMRLPFEVKKARKELRAFYSWAIPTDEAIEEIAKLGAVVEIGAGTGYWASLINEAGGRIKAFDIAPPSRDKNSYCSSHLFFEVEKGGTEVLENFSEASLFLCWPPRNQMALKSLETFTGEKVIYIGERWGGWTADHEFERKLILEFTQIGEIEIPCWPGSYDDLSIWQRK